MEGSIKKAGEIITRYEKIWLGLESVTAVGTGKTKEDRPCIIISMTRDDADTRNLFPSEIEGIPVEFRVSGEINAL